MFKLIKIKKRKKMIMDKGVDNEIRIITVR